MYGRRTVIFMKKMYSVFMALVLIVSLAACGSGKDADVSNPSSGIQEPESNDESSSDAPEPSVELSSAEQGDESSSDAPEPGQSGEPSAEEQDGAEAKALVVYFSVTGNTKAVAETLAKLQDADIYEIVPQQPYTDEDLNYNDRTTRATAEQDDPEARPAIQGSITDFEQYDIVYVGYPIWWGDMPRILYTFFDTYDFSGKTIAPFCTSGGSGLSGTPKTIAGLEAGAEVLDGLSVGSSQADNSGDAVADWLGGLGLAK